MADPRLDKRGQVEKQPTLTATQLYGQYGRTTGLNTKNTTTQPGAIAFRPGISVGVEFQGIAKFWRPGYQKSQVLKALTEAHRKMARDVQLAQAEELRRAVLSTKRTQRPGQRLEKAWVNDGNALVRPNNFVVGVPPYLESSPAKRYYRTIAEGLTIKDKLVYGYFTSDAAGKQFSENPRFDARLIWGGNTGWAGTTQGVDKAGRPTRAKKFRIVYRFFRGYNFVQRGFVNWYTQYDPMTYYNDAFAAQGLDVATEWNRVGGTALPITKEPPTSTLSQISRRNAKMAEQRERRKIEAEIAAENRASGKRRGQAGYVGPEQILVRLQERMGSYNAYQLGQMRKPGNSLGPRTPAQYVDRQGRPTITGDAGSRNRALVGRGRRSGPRYRKRKRLRP